ncbi:hypothetical protein HMPREF9012_0981 [Bacteroidetes bacterium oral taxon 272 str. F0290]|nr:hypothetical protein HMPREF9012_0981 [Bacteroidetes bacterium oral taxon 272 str. F0290]
MLHARYCPNGSFSNNVTGYNVGGGGGRTYPANNRLKIWIIKN